jgi:tRNA modification GTPase
MRPRLESTLDTIAAPATPPGRSALAVVRVSGPASLPLLRAIAPQLTEDPEPRKAVLTLLRDASGEVIDRALATYFRAPASYTGEDCLELSVHGGPIVVRRLLSALCAAGARPARAGEFTERAFLSGRMDLIEAEAVRDLIAARTEAAARASLANLEGSLSKALREIRDRLAEAAAHLAATIDFAEDVGERVPASVRENLVRARSGLSELLASAEAGRLLSTGCRVAILGRPNAGKSTLFNALAGSDRAIVTEIPGTTRDLLEAPLEIGGIPVDLVDTAGLRESADIVESLGVQRARAELSRAEAILYVFEAGRGLDEIDREAIAAAGGKPLLLLANKIDLAAHAALPEGAVSICGLGRDAGERLHDLLAGRLSGGLDLTASGAMLATERQREAVARALRETGDAETSLERGDSPEYAATHLDGALAALAELAGETTSEEVLGRVFAGFCIGK